jgi:hypothetical protein
VDGKPSREESIESHRHEKAVAKPIHQRACDEEDGIES